MSAIMYRMRLQNVQTNFEENIFIRHLLNAEIISNSCVLKENGNKWYQLN